MSKSTPLAAVTVIVLLAAATPPASAQAANTEPGYCAQFYPNSDCNSVGPATPESNKTQGDPIENDASEAASAAPPVKPAKPRKQAHRSDAIAAGAKAPKTDAAK
ncbi:hypothetical protein [uncultured Bradyrhizobium sp.]|uniref:hypothetical protein n=1 Tax=uncultured Bradyrhizobium sp. TaxID=199684 RepID=UPI0035C94AAE